MRLQQLESFVWVARLRSFRAAAARLNMTQPGVSLRIQELEKEVGASLLDRSKRAVSLTAEGRDCLAYAEQIMTWSAELRTRAQSKNPRGRVSLGVSEMIAHTWLSDLLSTMSVRYPEVQIDPTIDMTPALLRGLEGGDYDVILAGAHRLTTTFPVLDLGETSFHWFGKDPLGNKPPPFTPRDLEGSRIITWSKDAEIYRSIEHWFISNGAHPARRITCNTAATMATLAAAGLGITLLPTELVRRELADGTLRIIQTDPEFEPVRYHAIYVPTRQVSLGQIVAEAARKISSFKASAPSADRR
jgi:DNA-binding transcriptional LysR family regulator